MNIDEILDLLDEALEDSSDPAPLRRPPGGGH